MTIGLHRLSDELEISRLLYAYCAAYDAGRWADTARLFESGVWYVSEDVALRGVDEITSFLESSIKLYDGVPRTRHNLSNIRIDISEDRSQAQSESSVVVFQSPPGTEPRILIQGAYQDKFLRAGGVWRFAERRATVDGTSDLSTHFAVAEAASQ